MPLKQTFFQTRLPNGIELAIEVMPDRRVVAADFRILTGMVDEPEDLLGLAHLTEQTLSKGTAKRTGQQLSDAFDAIGVQQGTSIGRESFLARCLCLPEFLGQTIELEAELLRTPSFPPDVCKVAVELGLQELTAMEDEPDELARRLLAKQAYGERLGRHPLGTAETLGRITREAIHEFWSRNFAAARMQVTMAGPVEPQRVVDQIEAAFAGFGASGDNGRAPVPIAFTPVRTHQAKELEQEQLYLCWPGVAVTDRDYAIEKVILAILSDGMSSRLFVEVREKLGLVYWVGAWHENPRSGGMIFVGASTTPARCDETYRVLLQQVDRLAHDITDDELRRAKVGLTAKSQTHGDITRARASELSSDMFYFGRPVPMEEKERQVLAVSQADIRDYLARHPRDRLSVVTLGPRPLAGE